MTTALVLGGAACVWADVAAALELGEFDGVVACNDVAVEWPGPLAALVTLHAEKADLWLARRARRGLSAPARVIGHLEAEGRSQASAAAELIEFRFPGQQRTGSSGLFALKVALLDLGFDKALLCGVPMTPAPHFFDASDWRGANVHRHGWTEALPAIAGRARSMSGWTADLLGRPDPAWLGASELSISA